MSDDTRNGRNSSEVHEESSASSVGYKGADMSRRKFAKTGLIAAPVIMSLNSRSALGAGYSCTISGLLSGNLSNPGYDDLCGGNTPGYWKNHYPFPGGVNEGQQLINPKTGKLSKKLWDDSGTKFHEIFDGELFLYDLDGNYRNYTLMQILWNFASVDANANQNLKDWYELGAHSSAAYLNAWASVEGTDGFGNGVVYGMSPDQVVALYNTYYATAPEQLKVVFQMYNENNRDAAELQALLGTL